MKSTGAPNPTTGIIRQGVTIVSKSNCFLDASCRSVASDIIWSERDKGRAPILANSLTCHRFRHDSIEPMLLLGSDARWRRCDSCRGDRAPRCVAGRHQPVTCGKRVTALRPGGVAPVRKPRRRRRRSGREIAGNIRRDAPAGQARESGRDRRSCGCVPCRAGAGRSSATGETR